MGVPAVGKECCSGSGDGSGSFAAFAESVAAGPVGAGTGEAACNPASPEACCGGKPGCVALTALKAGQVGVVHPTTGLNAADAALLRAMGLRPNSRIRMCRTGEPCIVEVMPAAAGACEDGCCCRIGLARPLAALVMVDQVGAP